MFKLTHKSKQKHTQSNTHTHTHTAYTHTNIDTKSVTCRNYNNSNNSATASLCQTVPDGKKIWEKQAAWSGLAKWLADCRALSYIETSNRDQQSSQERIEKPTHCKRSPLSYIQTFPMLNAHTYCVQIKYRMFLHSEHYCGKKYVCCCLAISRFD